MFQYPLSKHVQTCVSGHLSMAATCRWRPQKIPPQRKAALYTLSIAATCLTRPAATYFASRNSFFLLRIAAIYIKFCRTTARCSVKFYFPSGIRSGRSGIPTRTSGQCMQPELVDSSSNAGLAASTNPYIKSDMKGKT